MAGTAGACSPRPPFLFPLGICSLASSEIEAELWHLSIPFRDMLGWIGVSDLAKRCYELSIPFRDMRSTTHHPPYSSSIIFLFPLGICQYDLNNSGTYATIAFLFPLGICSCRGLARREPRSQALSIPFRDMPLGIPPSSTHGLMQLSIPFRDMHNRADGIRRPYTVFALSIPFRDMPATVTTAR